MLAIEQAMVCAKEQSRSAGLGHRCFFFFGGPVPACEAQGKSMSSSAATRSCVIVIKTGLDCLVGASRSL